MPEKPKTTAFYRKRLPHWEVEDGKYFVTIRVTGSIPSQAVQELREIIRQLKQSSGDGFIAIQRNIFRKIEGWLDESRLNCCLSNPEVASIIMNAIEYRQKIGIWEMLEYVLMPNHIHMFFSSNSSHLDQIMPEFKRWTGTRANKVLNKIGERFWQRDWFDHWSRTAEEDDKIIEYIRQNPVKAGLVEDFLDWRYSSWTKRTS
ncbi:MAG: transposase [Candidatus Electryonea clarkiae]|nr:transposase [Candidatus Electryonea clarkiae]MDP8285824.1 transposase [Candidatus Electryonea clarkiae]